MQKFRKLMRYLILGTLLVMLIQASLPTVLDGSGIQIDDWAFNVIQKQEESPTNKTLVFFMYVVAFWLIVEFLRHMVLYEGFRTIAILGGIIVFLASISGPMISSITDQGFRDPMSYATGGAKDITNFRQNLERGYLPSPDSVTYEGLFYDYSFDNGEKSCDQISGENSILLNPICASAISKHPLTGVDEYFLSVGFKSGISSSEWKRKKLNLVIALDISGSMSSSFKDYYYGGYRSSRSHLEAEGDKDKLQVAAESVCSILEKLGPDDSFGMILFNHNAHLAKPMRRISETDVESIKKHICELEAQGGTNMEAGLLMSMGMLEGKHNVDQNEFENRIIFLTDAMPNTDDTSEDGLLALTQQAEKTGAHMTFVGIGIDFNPELVEKITKVRGANYYSVNSSEEFTKRLVGEFDFMVSPMLYNLSLNLESTGFEIEKVYGSPEANEATGQIMKIRTLFPTSTSAEGVKGGIVLLKLKKIGENDEIRFSINYEDRSNKKHQGTWARKIKNSGTNFHESTGIRKGIMLARYGELMKLWLGEEHFASDKDSRRDQFRRSSGYWEHIGKPLTIHQDWTVILAKFNSWFEAEISQVNDKNLEKELKTIKKLQTLSKTS